MAKLSFIKNVINPNKRSGAKKNLLRRDGIASDADGIKDDGSSSLSERQEKAKSKSKKKFSARALFRKIGTRSGTEEDGGYESDVSAGSTRSTSSSFLRYQNRAVWKAKLMKKYVLQRLGDGTETQVEEQTKPWPLFDGIYKRQNQVGDDADGDDEDDNDSISSIESDDGGCPLAPPAPIFSLESEEEEWVEEIEIPLEPCDLDETEGDSPELGAENNTREPGAFDKIRSLVQGGPSAGGSETNSYEIQGEANKLVESAYKDSHESSLKSDPESSNGADADMRSGEEHEENHQIVESASKDRHEVMSNPNIGSGLNPIKLPGRNENHVGQTIPSKNTKQSEAQSPPSDFHSEAQTSGISTFETPKANIDSTSASSLPQARVEASSGVALRKGVSKTPQAFPTQKLNESPKKVKIADAKPPTKPSRKKKKASVAQESKEVVPISIPRTISYSLRSAIGDGSARQRNSHSLMERRPLRPNGCPLDTSYWSHRGKRNYMEDRFVIEHVGSTSKDKKISKPITLLAVFDGHGGSAVSQFCSDWLSSYIRKKNEHFPTNLPLAMKSAFIKIDSDFVSSGQFDGTTACACVVVGKKVICCNAGDSRAIIVRRDGSAFALSEDHKPDRNDETKRINDLGGRVIHWGRWRVEGVLAVSRSIGDAKLKPYVTAEPDIVEHEIGDDDMFLVVASDGVWDTMSSDLVAKFVLVNTCKIVDKHLEVDEKLLRWIARQVSKRARENGSSDNISCIVANLKGKCS